MIHNKTSDEKFSGLLNHKFKILAKKEERKMKKVLILVLGLLFIGVNVFAAGDLQVNGSLGVGTTPSAKKIDVLGDVKIVNTSSGASGAVKNALYINSVGDGTLNAPGLVGINALAKAVPGDFTNLMGFWMQAQHETDQNIPSLEGGYFLVQYRSDSNTTVTDSSALHILHSKSTVSTGQTTVTDGYGLLSEVRDEPSSGALNFGSFSHLHLLNPDAAISATNLTGLWIDKQTEGTNNRGIVLNGDGAGSDIVLGASQEASIYASGGEIYVKDGLSNVTQISPHDPETGEWRFYSKNVRTGRVVEINMEKLVKAVEKLTGETFMIETFADENN